MTFTLSLTRGSTAAGEPAQMALSGTDLVVGSSVDCGWRLLDGVAPRHCQFGFRGGQWLVVDLGGGTSVNGRALDRPVAIAMGDAIVVGYCAIAVADAAAAAAAPHGNGVADRPPGHADALLRQLVAGLVAQLAGRARAKAEMGAEATQFALGGVNPLKALPADRALAALLTPEPGTMPPERAVAEAFAELEAHGAATLAGMQQALAATLERFSPAAIRGRAQAGGVLARVVPGAKEAALWQAYEREFDGVVKGSSDAFVELFASEFRRAYQAVSSAPRRPS